MQFWVVWLAWRLDINHSSLQTLKEFRELFHKITAELGNNDPLSIRVCGFDLQVPCFSFIPNQLEIKLTLFLGSSAICWVVPTNNYSPKGKVQSVWVGSLVLWNKQAKNVHTHWSNCVLEMAGIYRKPHTGATIYFTICHLASGSREQVPTEAVGVQYHFFPSLQGQYKS